LIKGAHDAPDMILPRRGGRIMLASSCCASNRVMVMAKDAPGAHARDELGITTTTIARPIQAALTSAASFTFGACMPVLLVVFSPTAKLIVAEVIGSLLFLALLGAIGGATGGANIGRLVGTLI
jgi:VIT1/CCC1 family predicted Fe2+/Mn2+ transporter